MMKHYSVDVATGMDKIDCTYCVIAVTIDDAILKVREYLDDEYAEDDVPFVIGVMECNNTLIT